MGDDRMIGFLTEMFDLFHNYTGNHPTRLTLPLGMYHKLVKEMQQRRPPLALSPDSLAAECNRDHVFEFDGVQVSRCNSGILRHVGAERVNEELRIS